MKQKLSDLSKYNRKLMKHYMSNGVPESVLFFLYNTQFEMFEDLRTEGALEELEASGFPTLNYIISKGALSYLSDTEDGVKACYEKLLAKSEEWVKKIESENSNNILQKD